MTTDISVLANQVSTFKDEAEFIRAYVEVKNALAFLRECKDKLERTGIEFMQGRDIREIWIEPDKVKLYLAKDKKDRFDTPAIYKALAFTQEQIDVLPKNPAFKKTAILANEKTAPAHWEEEKDVLKLQELDLDMMKKVTSRNPRGFNPGG